MNRTEILKTAEKYVSADRSNQYGEPEDNFALIAEYWSVYLGGTDTILDAFDVSMMMALLKVARLSKRPDSPDSAIDLADYAACAGEILEDTRTVARKFKDPVSSLHSDPSVPPRGIPTLREGSSIPQDMDEVRSRINRAAKYTPADPKILTEASDVF